MKNVSFIGLGAMGRAMVPNLLAAGYAVTVHNRTKERAKPLLDLGATWADSPAEAVEPKGLVLTILSDDQALSEVCEGPKGLLQTLGRGGLHLSMSTVSPALIRRLAVLHRAKGAGLLGSPVFGRPEAAVAAKLWICLSGPADGRQEARPVLEALSQKVFEFGEDPAAAHVVKLCGNFMLASAVEAMSEAYVLAEKNGIPRQAVHDLLSTTIFPGPVHQGYGKRVAEDSHLPAGFKLALGLKDVQLALATAQESGVEMPLGELCQRRLSMSRDKGRGEMDLSALVLEAAEQAGLRKG